MSLDIKLPGLEPLAGEGGTSSEAASPWEQGLTLVQFSAQLERFVWDRGCA